MAAPPSVSIVITTFRREKLVPEAIASALAQPGSREVLVYDDSAEGTARAVVEGLGTPDVTYHKCEAPSGGRPGLVRNLAAALTRGRDT